MLKTVKGNVSLSTLFFLMPDMTQMVRYNYFSLVFPDTENTWYKELKTFFKAI